MIATYAVRGGMTVPMQAWYDFMRQCHTRPGLPLAVLDEVEVLERAAPTPDDDEPAGHNGNAHPVLAVPVVGSEAEAATAAAG